MAGTSIPLKTQNRQKVTVVCTRPFDTVIVAMPLPDGRRRSETIPRRKRSTSSTKYGILSVTARKYSEGDKVGVELKEEEGRYMVTKISSDGIFAESELQVGDSVLSVNGESIKDLFMDELLEVADRAEDFVTFVVRQMTKF